VEELLKKLQAIQARLGVLSAQEDFAEGELEELEQLAEDATKIERQINAKKRSEEILASANKGTGRQVAGSQAAPAPRVQVAESKDDLRHGFKSAGEFFKAVAIASNSNNMQVDDRLKKFQNVSALEKIGEDGGFLIPTDFRSEIMKKISGDESLLPKTRQFRTSLNNITMPLSETAPWVGTGIQAKWEGEAVQYSESKPKLGEFSARLHKLTALVPVSEELLSDAPLLESFLSSQAPEAMVHKINSAIINGTGVGMPKGFLQSSFKYKVAKEAGPQTADTIIFENIVKMQARILPASFARSFWLVNPGVMEQLRLMAFVKGAASPVPAYLPPSGLAEAPYGTLMGRPILPMMGATSALGDEGDISLVDLSYYFSLIKTDQVTSSMSTHLWFDKDLVAFKYSFRMGGAVPYLAPVTTEKGNFAMSGIVTLEDR